MSEMFDSALGNEAAGPWWGYGAALSAICTLQSILTFNFF